MTLLRLRQALDPLPDEATVPVRWIRELLGSVGTSSLVDSTVGDVAAAVGRAPSTVRGWCRAGRLPDAYRLHGREWRIPAESLQALRQNATTNNKDKAPSRRRKADLADWRRVRASRQPNKGGQHGR